MLLKIKKTKKHLKLVLYFMYVVYKPFLAAHERGKRTFYYICIIHYVHSTHVHRMRGAVEWNVDMDNMLSLSSLASSSLHPHPHHLIRLLSRNWSIHRYFHFYPILMLMLIPCICIIFYTIYIHHTSYIIHKWREENL